MESVGNLVLYFVVAAIITIFSVMAVTSRKILRSATYLLFVLIGTAILYFQLGYEFLGAVQIAVYAGGILVLFVFSILLTAQPNDKSEKLSSHRKFMGIAAALCGVGVIAYALFSFSGFTCESLSNFMTSENEITMHKIGQALMGTEKFQYLLPFEAISVLLLACIIGGIVVARKR